ncbi:hypothetical protein MMPV_000072 [Pyropia vietnamensis]
MAFVSAAATAGLGLRAPGVAGTALGVAARRVRLAPLSASRVRMSASATPKDDKNEEEKSQGGLEATPRGNASAYRRGRGGGRGWRSMPSLWGLSTMRPDLLAGELTGAFDSPFFRAGGGLFAGGWPSAALGADWAPRADLTVSADGKSYEWAVELPGMSKDDVKLSIDGDVLTVRGEKRSEREVVGGGTERLWGTFTRSIVAPADADLDKSSVKAVAKDGVLTVSFPKTSPQEEEHAGKEDNTIPIMGE